MTTSSDKLVPDKWKLASPETGRPAILAWAFPIDASGFIVDLHVRWPLAMDDHVINRGNCRGHIHIVKRSSVPFQGIAEARISHGWMVFNAGGTTWEKSMGLCASAGTQRSICLARF